MAPFIQTVGGTTGITVASLKRPADTTAYAVADALGVSTVAASCGVLVFSGAARSASGTGYITKVRCMTDQASCVAQIRLWLFSANSQQGLPTSPIVSADNAAFLIQFVDAPILLGYIDIPALSTEGSSNVAQAQDATIRVMFQSDANAAIYGLLETKTAFTPASMQNFFVELTVERN